MGALLLILMTLGISTFSGVALFKLSDQEKKNRQLVTYELTFPNDLSVDRIVAFLTNISGSKAARRQFGGVRATGFELQAREGRIRAFLRVPEHLAGGVIRQLHGAIPSMVAALHEEPFDYPVTQALEVGLSNPSKPIYVRDGADMNTAILKSIDALKDGESAVIQLMVVPVYTRIPGEAALSDVFHWSNMLSTPKSASGDELRARKAKLETPNFRGVLRIATHAPSPARAKSIAEDIKRTFDATSTDHNNWRLNPRRLTSLITDMREGRAPALSANYLQLSTPELAALVGWQIKGAAIAGLPSGRTAPLQASRGVPSKGRIFGTGNHPETSRPLAVSSVESCKHFHIVGRTGAGKTALAANLAAQDIREGRGLVVIDPKFDLFNAVLNYVPKERLDDVVVFDVNDTANPVGFNMLTQGTPQTVASEVQAIFDHIYKDSGAVRMPEVLYHLLITLMTTSAKTGPYAFVDIVPLISPSNREESLFAQAVKGGIKDPYIKAWWEQIDKLSANERTKYFQSLRSRIWQLNSRAEIRNIIGQSESSIDLTDIVRNKKILLVNLKGLPEEVSALIGSLIVNNLWHVSKMGYTSEANPFMLYLDEFQHFVHTPISPETLLAEGRSFGLSMHLMHQGLDQLEGRRQVEAGVMNNAVNKIVFQRGRRDAAVFAAEFGAPVTDEALKKLGKYEFIARVASEDGISPPLTGTTVAPLEPFNYAKEARIRSRQRYGRSVYEVNAAILARRRVGGTAREQEATVGRRKVSDEV